RRLQRLAPTAMEGGAATTRRRDRPDHPGLPLSAGDLEVEQDRAPHVLPHYPELARHASRQPPRGHRTDRKHDDENRPQNPLRTRSQRLSQGHQDLRRANGDTQHKAGFLPSRMELQHLAQTFERGAIILGRRLRSVGSSIGSFVGLIVGGRDGDAAYDFIDDLAPRVASREQNTTDGHKAYLDAIDTPVGDEVNYAMNPQFPNKSPR